MTLYNIDKLVKINCYKRVPSDYFRVKKCVKTKFWSRKKVTYYSLRGWLDFYENFDTKEELLKNVKENCKNYILEEDFKCYEAPEIRFVFEYDITHSKIFKTDTEMLVYLAALKEKYPQIVNYLNPDEL